MNLHFLLLTSLKFSTKLNPLIQLVHCTWSYTDVYTSYYLASSTKSLKQNKWPESRFHSYYYLVERSTFVFDIYSHLCVAFQSIQHFLITKTKDYKR